MKLYFRQIFYFICLIYLGTPLSILGSKDKKNKKEVLYTNNVLIPGLDFTAAQFNDLMSRCMAFSNTIHRAEALSYEENSLLNGVAQINVASSARRVIQFYVQRGRKWTDFLKHDAIRTKFKKNTLEVTIKELFERALTIVCEHPSYQVNTVEQFVERLFSQVLKLQNNESNPKSKVLLDLIRIGSVEQLEKFLDSEHYEIDCMDEFSLTPLYYAIALGNKEIIDLLLKHSASINWKMKGGTIPLLISPDNDIEQMLLKNGADINHIGLDGDTPLITAARNTDTVLVKRLIKGNANVNLQGSNGRTALHWILEEIPDFDMNNIECCRDHTVLETFIILRSLVDAKASCEIFDKSGHSALMLAIKKGKYNIINLLKGCNIISLSSLNKPNKNGDVALSILCRECLHGKKHCEHKVMATLLVSYGAHVNGIENEKPPLFIAIEHGDIDLVEILIKCGADLFKEFQNKTPLECAAEQNKKKSKKIVEMLRLAIEKKTEPMKRSAPIQKKQEKESQSKQPENEKEKLTEKKRAKLQKIKEAKAAEKLKKKEEKEKIEKEKELELKKIEEKRKQDEETQKKLEKERLERERLEKENEKKANKKARRVQRKIEEQAELKKFEDKKKQEEALKQEHDKNSLLEFAKAQTKVFIQELENGAIEKAIELRKSQQLEPLLTPFLQKKEKNLQQAAFKAWKNAVKQKRANGKKDSETELNSETLHKQMIDFEKKRIHPEKAKSFFSNHLKNQSYDHYTAPLILAQMSHYADKDHVGWLDGHVEQQIRTFTYEYLWNKDNFPTSRPRIQIACKLCAPHINTETIKKNSKALHWSTLDKAQDYQSIIDQSKLHYFRSLQTVFK